MTEASGYLCPDCQRLQRGCYVLVEDVSVPLGDPFDEEVRMGPARPDQPWVASCPFGHQFLVREWTRRAVEFDTYDLEPYSGPVPDDSKRGAE